MARYRKSAIKRLEDLGRNLMSNVAAGEKKHADRSDDDACGLRHCWKTAV